MIYTTSKKKWITYKFVCLTNIISKQLTVIKVSCK